MASTTIKIPYYDTVPLDIPGVITTGDNKAKQEMPFRGEFVAHSGFIGTLGAGAGTVTRIQVRNVTQGKDYFTTRPYFSVDSATNLLEGGIFATDMTFNQGDVIAADVDDISTNPGYIYLQMLARFIREVAS